MRVDIVHDLWNTIPFKQAKVKQLSGSVNLEKVAYLNSFNHLNLSLIGNDYLTFFCVYLFPQTGDFD